MGGPAIRVLGTQRTSVRCSKCGDLSATVRNKSGCQKHAKACGGTVEFVRVETRVYPGSTR